MCALTLLRAAQLAAAIADCDSWYGCQRFVRFFTDWRAAISAAPSAAAQLLASALSPKSPKSPKPEPQLSTEQQDVADYREVFLLQVRLKRPHPLTFSSPLSVSCLACRMQPKAMHKSAPPLTAAQLADARAIRSCGHSYHLLLVDRQRLTRCVFLMVQDARCHALARGNRAAAQDHGRCVGSCRICLLSNHRLSPLLIRRRDGIPRLSAGRAR